MEESKLIARVRRLAADGDVLYVQLGAADVRRLALQHGESVELQLGSASIKGVVKVSGGSGWLAPGTSSNAAITGILRAAGHEHGADVPAVLYRLNSTGPGAGPPPLKSTTRGASSPHHAVGFHITPAEAVRAVRAYNGGTYRGRSNVEIDRAAYMRFRGGLPTNRVALIDAIRFVGEDYGGAQARFLPHSYTHEAELIVRRLYPNLVEYQSAVNGAVPLETRVPEVDFLEKLLDPFQGTKRWPVWASKTLHFLRPDAFPILDSRAKEALRLANLAGSAADYRRFCAAVRSALEANAESLIAAQSVDAGESPSKLKLFDKILYEIGGETKLPGSPSA